MKDVSGGGNTPGLPTVLGKIQGQARNANETTRTKGGRADETWIVNGIGNLGTEETKKTNAKERVTSASEAETGQGTQKIGTATEAETRTDDEGKKTPDQTTAHEGGHLRQSDVVEEQMRRENGDHDLARPDAAVEKQKPNYSASGLLAKEANTIAGSTTVLKYHEPPEARKPPAHEQWRMFIFKGDELLDTVHLFSRSCWLLGRDEKVTDLWLEHPSISKQHAVIQFRYIAKKNEYGDVLDTVKPYLIDLESANFTRLNKKKIAESRFVELRDGDVMTFGDSTREYVLMLPPPDKED
ncbi:hypothetical protein MBLNU457_g0002t2 [Dothideomycetes sp. NU457]